MNLPRDCCWPHWPQVGDVTGSVSTQGQQGHRPQKPLPGSHTREHDRWRGQSTESVPPTTTSTTTTTTTATTSTSTTTTTTTTASTTGSGDKSTEKFDWRQWLASRSKLSTTAPTTLSTTVSTSSVLSYAGNKLKLKSTGRLLNGFYMSLFQKSWKMFNCPGYMLGWI